MIGKPDPVAKMIVKAFVCLKPGYEPSDDLRRDLIAFARRKLGAAVAPREIEFVDSIPHNRSGKIMRRVLKARELRTTGGRSLDDGAGAMSIATTLNREHGLQLLRQMLLVRRFEEKCVELYSATKIRGFLHLYIGEEAVAVGVMQALEPRGRDRRDLPRARSRARPRRLGRVDHGGDVREGRGLLARAGRIDAPVRRRDAVLRRQRDRRRWSAARDRSRRSPTSFRDASA